MVKEMALLGYMVSESTVHRFRDRSTKPPSQTWRTFLKNHMDVTVAIDFFTMATVSFQIRYCFIILDHARRRILHFNVTDRYYNEVRCHESLDGNAPIPREQEAGPGRVKAIPFLGGLHHRYTRQAA